MALITTQKVQSMHSKIKPQTAKKIELFSMYRHSSIYAVNVGTQKNRRSKNRINRGYLVVIKGREIG